MLKFFAGIILYLLFKDTTVVGALLNATSKKEETKEYKFDPNDVVIEKKCGDSRHPYWQTAGGGWSRHSAFNTHTLQRAASNSKHGQSRARNRKTGEILEYGFI